MSLKVNLLSITKPCANSSGIVAHRCVTSDPSNVGDVRLAVSTDRTFYGITIENQNTGSNDVAIQTHGVALAENDGTAVINPGDFLVISGTSTVAGRVKTQSVTAGTSNLYHIIGMCADDVQIPATAGAYVSVLIQPGFVMGL